MNAQAPPHHVIPAAPGWQMVHLDGDGDPWAEPILAWLFEIVNPHGGYERHEAPRLHSVTPVGIDGTFGDVLCAIVAPDGLWTIQEVIHYQPGGVEAAGEALKKQGKS